MRAALLIPILCLAFLTGCRPATEPRLLPASVSSQAPSLDDICVSWRQALDGYDVAGERRRLADVLRARGEDPSRCETSEGRKAVPLSPSATPPMAQRGSAERAAPAREAQTARSTGRRLPIKPSLSCTSEVVKGPPDRYKTVCR